MILDSDETRKKVLTEFLTICCFEGWNNKALDLSLEKCEIDQKFRNIIFENGVVSLAEFFIDLHNKEAATQISKIENFSSKKIRDKIRLWLFVRFELEARNKIALQRLINFYIDPKNLISGNVGLRPINQALKVCYKIADFIWHDINDQSSDFNFYTKRVTLGKIIFCSFLVFLKDNSVGHEKTKDFINAQIEKVMRFEKNKAQTKKIITSFSSKATKKIGEIFIDENGLAKSPKEILKELPFIRLWLK